MISRRAFFPLIAAGTVLAPMAVRSGGSAHASETTGRTALAATVGFTERDLDPRRSSLGQFGFGSGFALDFNYRSIGAAFATSTRITGIELVSSYASNDLTSRELSLYQSEDNQNWTKVSSARVINLGNAIGFTGFDVTCRFLKVHCHRETKDLSRFSFALPSSTAISFSNRAVPGLIFASNGLWLWRSELVVTNPASTVLRDRAAYLSAADLGLPELIRTGKVRSDLADLRFVDAAGAHLHAYADSDGIFVRIPRIEPDESVRVSFYSGNTQARDIVHVDAAALQVEYGKRTIQHLDDGKWGRDVRPVRLPSGLVVLAGGRGGGVFPVQARYSADDGRTFGPPERFIDPPDPSRAVSMGSLAVDPDTGVLTACVYQGFTQGEADFLDASKRNCRSYIVQARNYDASGRPIFGPPVELRPYSHLAGQMPVWVVSYTNVLKTRAGTYLLPVSYAYTREASFAVAVFRSTDGGATWTQGVDELHLAGSGFEGGISETALIELTDGRIVYYSRQQRDERYTFATGVSSDDGVSWSGPDESTVMASNTFPASFRREGGRVDLTWSGHNAWGMTSYRRNMLTAAWATDDRLAWQGYHDLLGATHLSAPGWGRMEDGFESAFVQADSAPTTPDDRIFAWWHGWNRPISLLVEDWADYLELSHGALDIARHRETGAVAYGGELRSSRWWRSTATGTLDLIAGQRPVGQAVRLRGAAAETVAASRTFPAIRNGQVRFRLRWVSVGTAADISVQEAFSADPNARGSILWLRLDSTGALTVTEDPRFRTEAAIGYVQDDADPVKGTLSNWNTVGGFAFDYRHRSIGMDVLAPNEFTQVTLTDAAGSTRLRPSDLTVWVSDKNQSDWRQVTSWSATLVGSTFTLTGPPAAGRYIKVHQPYGDTAFTFSNDLAKILTVQVANPDTISPRVFRPLAVPTTLDRNSWATIDVLPDLTRGMVTIRVNGRRRDTLPILHPAAVITHALVRAQGQSSAGTEIAVDEFLVRDLALSQPVFLRRSTTREVPPRLR